MKAAVALAALLVGCSSAPPGPPAFPQACPACSGQPTADEKVLVSDNMLGERWGELNPTINTRMTLISGSLEPHVRGGGGFEFAKGITRNDRWRFIQETTLSGGAWGDQHHGQFMIESGAGLRVTLCGDLTLANFYIQATDGLIWGFGGLNAGQSDEMGNVANLGLGFRLFRAFSLELTGGLATALDTSFKAADGTTERTAGEFGLALRFDLCSLGSTCNYSPIPQKVDDRTCGLYKEARDICRKASAAERAALCTAAVTAMSMEDSGAPVLARKAVSTFLANLAHTHHETAHLAEADECMTMWRSCGRKEECLLAQQEEQAAVRRMYSPFAVEVLSALGCTADGKPKKDCEYKCDAPGDTPAVCGGR